MSTFIINKIFSQTICTKDVLIYNKDILILYWISTNNLLLEYINSLFARFSYELWNLYLYFDTYYIINKRGFIMFKITKVLNYLSIVTDVIFFIVFIFFGSIIIANDELISNSSNANEVPAEAFVMVGVIFLFIAFLFVVMIGLSIIYNQKLNKAKTPNELIGWSVVMIIFGYFLVGLFGLLLTQEELDKKNNITNPDSIKVEPVVTTSSSVADKESSTEDKLIKIKALYEEGIITEEEYNQKRKEIINNF